MLQHTYEIPNASLIATRNIHKTQKLYSEMHQKFGRKIHIYRYQFVNTFNWTFLAKIVRKCHPFLI